MLQLAEQGLLYFAKSLMNVAGAKLYVCMLLTRRAGTCSFVYASDGIEFGTAEV